MMNSIVEKLAAIENEVAAIQPKMAPLTERIADLDQKVTLFARQLSSIAEESASVKQDIELTRQGLTRIQTLIGESKIESELFVAGQEENQQRCETMQAVFGAAFQAVSQFYEAAQRMGFTDQTKTVFLDPQQGTESADDRRQTVAETVQPMPETLAEEVVHEPSVLETPPALEELPTWEPPTMESVLLESDFPSAIPRAEEQEPDSWAVPGLPDVVASPEIANHTDLDSVPSDAESDAEPSAEMASHLDVAPLNLSAPYLPVESAEAESDSDDQEIEDILANLMTPVTAVAGN